MATVAWFLFFGGLLVGCSAMEVPCRVTPDGSKTTYSIDSAPGYCYEYSFTNATKHVLAHATDHDPELVIRRNMSTLVTSQCMESITYHCNCISQGEVHAITSNCTTACSRKLEGGEDENGSPPETSSTWIPVAAVGLVLFVLFVLLVGVLAFLFFKFRKKSCCPHRCMYTGVKTADLRAADVEAGNH